MDKQSPALRTIRTNYVDFVNFPLFLVGVKEEIEQCSAIYFMLFYYFTILILKCTLKLIVILLITHGKPSLSLGKFH